MSTNNKECSISSIDDIEGINEIDNDANFDVTKVVCSRITESNFTVQFSNPKLQDPQKKGILNKSWKNMINMLNEKSSMYFIFSFNAISVNIIDG